MVCTRLETESLIPVIKLVTLLFALSDCCRIAHLDPDVESNKVLGNPRGDNTLFLQLSRLWRISNSLSLSLSKGNIEFLFPKVALKSGTNFAD